MKQLLLTLTMTFISITSFSNIIYVNPIASGNNDGTSWIDAYTNPLTAITGATSGDSLFIATCTVYTNSVTQIPEFVSLFGGFPNSGNPTWADRDWEANPVVFSGDFAQNDIDGNFATRSDNAARLFVGNTKYELNGIIVEHGGNDAGGSGCGIAHAGATSREGIIKNCIFRDNVSSNGGVLNGQGGAIRGVCITINDTLIIENTLFDGNQAFEGGAIYSQGVLIMNNCKVVNSRAARGAALLIQNQFFDAHVVANNTLFLDNGQLNGGNGGAAFMHIYCQSNFGHISEFTNCSIIGNHASSGSFKADLISTSSSISSASFTDVYFLNTIFYNPNFSASADKTFSGITDASLYFIDCMTEWDSINFFDGATPTLSTNNFNFSQTPIWEVEDNTINYEYLLDCNSPGVDAGDDMNYFGFATDLNGNDRSSGASIDLGAFETQFTTAPIITNSSGTLSVTTTFDNYQWNLNGSPISGATNATYITTQDGDYTVTATNNTGCSTSDISNVITIEAGASIAENSNIDISLYPNPTSGNIFIKTSEVISSIQLTDINGRFLIQTNNTNELNLSEFETGIYLIKIETENGTFVSKVSKN